MALAFTRDLLIDRDKDVCVSRYSKGKRVEKEEKKDGKILKLIEDRKFRHGFPFRHDAISQLFRNPCEIPYRIKWRSDFIALQPVLVSSRDITSS